MATDKLTLRDRDFNLSLGERMNPLTTSSREIIESPIEIGCDEVVPYKLTVPVSWGNPISNPIIEPLHVVSSGPTVQGRTILFSIDARHCLNPGEDCRIEIQFDIPGGVLEAWGIWQCKR